MLTFHLSHKDAHRHDNLMLYYKSRDFLYFRLHVLFAHQLGSEATLSKYFHTLEANVQARYREKLVKSTKVALIARHLPIRFTGCDVC